ncbi:alpha-amylase [Brucepastera parasyntrophica]|uniref:alpha-amylase n=1 Tax=Brucepastera parasyntrophica TaxID=2880008 RepID=UPI00210EA477|nr:alpha-amylase [Brucepastera parasyntrophica]ULQ60996.1 alpha-amylase [Brucepastera parasyntrophica]
MGTNGTMIQFFEWYLKPGHHWNQLRDRSKQLARDGFTGVWIPPAYKGSSGKYDVGYGVYDLFDLGEFRQKGTVKTKYGTKKELHAAIREAHRHGLQIYADVVLNHKMGADSTETVTVKEVNPDNRNEEEGGEKKIVAWTHFTFPGRHRRYSAFEWHWYHFTGIDWDEKKDQSGIYKFKGKHWGSDVDAEKGNFDYLMGADIDLENADVQKELIRWGLWFIEETGVDGFRFDAVKHMQFTFVHDWLKEVRKKKKEELFTVGEYWNADYAALKNYVDTTEGALSLFDVPLHYNFVNASQSNGSFDMRKIFDGTLTQDNPYNSVTFVDNHDTQPGQALQSWVQEWFKPLAYALILLREGGYPCVFYGDYYGIPHDKIKPMRKKIAPMVHARKHFAYGKQNDYFDHPNTIGWTREGDDEHKDSGLAVVMTDGSEGSKRMYVGQKFAGTKFYDCTGNRMDSITIEADGNATFPVNGGSVSVWIADRREKKGK